MDVSGIAVAISILGTAAIAAHVALKWMTLAHGRMLSADKQGQFERELSALSIRMKRTDELDTGHMKMGQLLEAELKRQDDVLEHQKQNLADIYAMLTRYEAAVQAQSDYGSQIDSITKWVREFDAAIVKNNAAVVNVAEEIVKLKEQQALALQGVVASKPTPFRMGPLR